MKNYIQQITIVLFLIAAQIFAFSLKAHAQAVDKHRMAVNADTSELIADETTISYTDKYAKIECNNDKVFMKLFTNNYQLVERFTASWKRDRYGEYKHYILYLKKEQAPLLTKWAKNNL